MVAAYATGQEKISPQIIEEMAAALKHESGEGAEAAESARQPLSQILQHLRQSSISPGQMALWRYRSALARVSRRQIVGVTLLVCLGVGLTLLKPLSEAWWGNEPSREITSKEPAVSLPPNKASKGGAARSTGNLKQLKRQAPNPEIGKPERSSEDEPREAVE